MLFSKTRSRPFFRGNLIRGGEQLETRRLLSIGVADWIATADLGASAELAATASYSFQDGVFPTPEYTGTRDTRIEGGVEDADTNFGPGVTLRVDGIAVQMNSLLKWDLSAIPASSTVQSVAMTIEVKDETADTYQIYEMKRPWVESEATFNQFAAGSPWEVPGANGTSDRGSTVLGTVTASAVGPATILWNAEGVALVQSWILDPSSNHGVIIHNGTMNDAIEFRSRNFGTPTNRPRLDVTVRVDGSNQPPVLDPIGNKSLDEGIPLGFTVTASDGNGDPLTYSAAGLPAGATFDPATRNFAWTPAEDQDGTHNVTFSVTDGIETVSETVAITVGEVNQSPTLATIGDRSAEVGTKLTFTISGDDVDLVSGLPNALTYSATGLPAGATLDPLTGVFTWIPSEGQDGTYPVTFHVSDGTDTAGQAITITVRPQGSSVAYSFQDGVFPDATYAGTRDTRIEANVATTNFGTGVTLRADGLDNAISSLLKWDLSAIPMASTVESVAMTIEIINTTSDTFLVYELKRPWVEREANFNEFSAGNPWEIPGGNGASDRGATVLGTVTASALGPATIQWNAEGVALVQSWILNPAGNHGVIIQNGSVDDAIEFRSRDFGTITNRPRLDVVVLPGRPNDLPVLAPIGNKSLDEGRPLEFTIAASDADEDPLTYSAAGLPAGATFDPVTRNFAWTPTESQEGTYAVTFSVNDGIGTVSETITITVGEVNQSPALAAIGNRSVDEGADLIFTITAADADLVGGQPNPLTYSATGLPAGATFAPATRSFAWTPTESQDGTYTVTFSVSDGTATVSETITITIGEVNQSPALATIGNRSVDEGTALIFTITAADTDVVGGQPDQLAYSAAGLPTGVTLDPATGVFAWTPAENQDGTFTVTFSVSDGMETVSETVTITVRDVNQPPSLAAVGNRSVDEGADLIFTITAADADLVGGQPNPLTYSAMDLPAGATFDPATRSFAWTPTENQDGTYTATFSVNDGIETVSKTITIAVGEINQPPTLAPIGNRSVDEGEALIFAITATDADLVAGQPNRLTYSATGLPAGATLDPATGVFAWTPAENEDGTHTVTFRAEDGAVAVSETVTITVSEINRPPVLAAIGNKPADAGEELRFSVSATDTDMVGGVPNTLIYSAADLPEGATFDPATRTFSWTPAQNQNVAYEVTFTVSDGIASDSETVTIAVGAPKLAPIGDRSVDEGALLSFAITASDSNGDPLTYSAGGLPAGAVFDPIAQTFTWTPSEDQDGVHSVTFRVNDGMTTISETIAITVGEINQPPVLAAIGDRPVNEGTELTFTISGSDADRVGGLPNSLTYSAMGLPQGAMLNPSTGAFSWTPTEGQDGTHSVTFRVSDGIETAEETITITVGEVNLPPVLTIGDQSVDEGSELSLTISASDNDMVDGLPNPLGYQAAGLPAGAVFDPATKTLTWTPAEDQDGTHSVTFTVSDGIETASETITITVGEVNQPPVLAPIGNQSIDEEVELSLTVAAHDDDLLGGLPNALTYSVEGLPAGAAFDSATRTFTWSPAEHQEGTHSVTFRVSDGILTALETITITVAEVNRLPVLAAIGNHTTNEATALTFALSAEDADLVGGLPNALTYSATGLPQGAVLDPVTGTFSWTPAEDQDGTHTITFRAGDGTGTASETITITVGEVNQPPVLAAIGNRSANEEVEFSFTVSAGDNDLVGGAPNTLTYMIDGLPAGAAFDPATRTFTWSPAEDQDGTHTVTFRVGDGIETASETITIVVGDVNRPPVFGAIGNRVVNEGAALNFTVSAGDSDLVAGLPNTLSYSTAALPAGAVFDPAARTFAWTPAEDQDGTHTVTFRVSDGIETVSETITIVVGEVNRSPVFAPIGNRTVNEEAALTFTVSAGDADLVGGLPNTLTYSTAALPAGAVFDPATRTFAWTPAEDQDGTHTVTFLVNDGVDTASQAITITVGEVNQPPVLAAIEDKAAVAGSELRFRVSAGDADLIGGQADALIYSAANLPAGATFDPATQTFSWTPTENQDGRYEVVFTVTDGVASVSQTMAIMVGAPVLEPIGNRSVHEGETLSFTIVASDPDQDPLELSASRLPAGTIFNTSTRTFTWTPAESQDGEYAVTFRVDDGTTIVSETITITVLEVNQPPTLAAIGNRTVNEGAELTFVISAGDADVVGGLPNPLTYSATGLPAGATFDPTTRTLAWTPAEDQDGTHTVTFQVSDGVDTASETITITVSDVNRPPVLAAIGDQSVDEETELTFTVSATDADLVAGVSNTLTYSAAGLPAGATFDPATRTFAWTPAENQDGSHTVTFQVSDGIDTAAETITIAVGEVNRLPVLAAIGNRSVDETEELTFTISAGDVDFAGGLANTLTYSATGLPAGAAFDPATRTFVWTPAEDQDGTHTVTFHVSDGIDTAAETISVTVAEVNRLPVLAAIGNRSADEAEELVFTISAGDADFVGGLANTLTYSATGLPVGAAFDPATRTFAWTPAEDQDGTHTVTFHVSDGIDTATETITVTVGEVNQPPVLAAIGDRTVDETAELTFTISAGDTDLVGGLPNALAYSAAQLPAGAAFDPATRIFTWAPSENQDGTHTVTFQVSDGVDTASQTITIIVAEINQPPVLATIDDQIAVAGVELRFTVQAGDADWVGGEPSRLTYAAANLPAGATFDPGTQIFSWIPTGNQDGWYEVTFTVSDGVASASETMAITVGAPVLEPIGNRSVNEGELLSFTITASDPDGDPLTYSVTTLPEGAVFDPLSRMFTWTPAEDQDGTYTATFRVDDGTTTVSETITMIVGEVNRPPVLAAIGDRATRKGIELTFAISATDADLVGGEPNSLSYSADGLPEGAEFDPSTQTFSWAPGENQDGLYSVTFTVSDGVASVSETVTIAVGVPVLDPIGERAVSEGETLSFSIAAGDPDQDPLTYSATGLPAGAVFDPVAQTFTWTPAEDQDGEHRVTFGVTDGVTTVSETITITVGESNQSPELATIGSRSVEEETALTFTISADDADLIAGAPDTLTYSATGLPLGATLDPGTGAFAWTPAEDQDGTHTVTFHASDGIETVSETITIAVGERNRAPVIAAVGDRSVDEGAELTFTISFSDSDLVGGMPNWLIFSVTGLPDGAEFDPVARSFGWTPAEGQDGTYTVSIQVSDGIDTAAEEITITVNEVNQPPVLAAIGNRTVDEGVELALAISSTDADRVGGLPNALVYSAAGLPAGAAFDPVTRTFAWIPTESQEGTYDVTFRVDDGQTTASETITITVSEVNRPPVLAEIGNKVVSEAKTLSFSVSASDEDLVAGLPNSLSYSVAGIPDGAAFDAGSQTFSWTPAIGQAGSYDLTFRVEDGTASDLETITIEVAPAPAIQTSTFQDGVLPSPDYAGTQDTMIRSGKGRRNHGTSGRLGGARDSAILLKWDLGNMELGSIVESASLTLHVVIAPSASLEIYQVQQDWLERESLSVSSVAGSIWQTGDESPAVLGVLTASDTGLATVELNAAGVAVVQAWIDDPAANHGLLIRDYHRAGPIRLASREAPLATDRPRLDVTFRPSGQPALLAMAPAAAPERAAVQTSASGGSAMSAGIPILVDGLEEDWPDSGEVLDRVVGGRRAYGDYLAATEAILAEWAYAESAVARRSSSGGINTAARRNDDYISDVTLLDD